MRKFINYSVSLLGGARVPKLVSVGGDRLSVKFDFHAREVFLGYGVDLFVDPVDFALKDGDTSKYKLLVLLAIWISRFVHVQQVHGIKPLNNGKKGNSQAGENPTGHEERSPA